MDLVLENGLVVDHILRHLTLKEKLQMRRLNSTCQDWIESWIRRTIRVLNFRELHEQEGFDVGKLTKLIQLSSKLDTLILNRNIPMSSLPGVLKAAKDVRELRISLMFPSAIYLITSYCLTAGDWKVLVLHLGRNVWFTSDAIQALSKLSFDRGTRIGIQRIEPPCTLPLLHQSFDCDNLLRTKIIELKTVRVNSPSQLNQLLNAFPNLECLGVILMDETSLDQSTMSAKNMQAYYYQKAIEDSCCVTLKTLFIETHAKLNEGFFHAIGTKWASLE